jgi:N6-adenosine-specific RNA methylase IME4
MNDLSVVGNNLPTTFEDVAQFAILAQEKLKSIKAEISAIKRLGLAQEVYEQKTEEAQQLSELAIRAQVKLGEISSKLPTSPGARTDLTSSTRDDEVTKQDALGKLGIKKQLASQYEAMAANPEIVEAAIGEARDNNDIVSRSFVLEKIKAKEREQKQAEVAQVVTPRAIPTGKYEVIYADPPWRYDFSETKVRDIENQYPTMDLESIKALKIPSSDNSVLFLWATAPKLPEAFEVMEAWGFSYKTCSVWDKEKIGMGYWFRGQHELLLVGTKGQVSPPPPQARESSVYRESRGEHSAKPKRYYEMIESMFPGKAYLELFARSKHSDDWEVWGNQY